MLLDNFAPIIIPVTKESQVASARQASLFLAKKLGFERTIAYQIATSVSELAYNLFFHTSHGGTFTIQRIHRKIHKSQDIGIQIISEDNGPGIPDVALAMQDNYSTNGGLGCGLPGVRRLMDDFKIHSIAGVGTRIIIRKLL